VDALSRRPTTCSLMEILVDWKSHLLVEYSKNMFACEILDGQVQSHRRCHLLQRLSLSSARIRSQEENFGCSTRLSISRPLGVLQNLSTGQGEILLEGSQTGCDETYQ
jgi:hypothetical protein